VGLPRLLAVTLEGIRVKVAVVDKQRPRGRAGPVAVELPNALEELLAAPERFQR